MTTTETAALKPAEHTYGLGELIRAYRMYIGLNQREMAVKLGKSRRDYQRIESGQDKCPPGLLSKVEELADQFDALVGRIIEAAERDEDQQTNVEVSSGPGWEWERLAAGRAAVITADEPGMPCITLTLSGNTPRERTPA